MRNRFVPGDLAQVGLPRCKESQLQTVMVVHIEEPNNTDRIYTVLTAHGSYEKVYQERFIRPLSRIEGAKI